MEQVNNDVKQGVNVLNLELFSRRLCSGVTCIRCLSQQEERFILQGVSTRGVYGENDITPTPFHKVKLVLRKLESLTMEEVYEMMNPYFNVKPDDYKIIGSFFFIY